MAKSFIRSFVHSLILLMAVVAMCACEKPEEPEVGGNSSINVMIDGVHYALSGTNAMVIPLPNEEQYQGEVMLPDTVFYHDTAFIVNEIHQNAFRGSELLTAVRIPKHVRRLPDIAFGMCSRLKTVLFASNPSLNSIGNLAFCQTSSLSTIELPAKVTSIGNDAFYYSGLQSIVLPEQLPLVQCGIFSHCERLETVTIGRSVIMIMENAFDNCRSLRILYCYRSTPPKVSNNAFYKCPINNCYLYVPASAVDAYKRVNPWMKFHAIRPIE